MEVRMNHVVFLFTMVQQVAREFLMAVLAFWHL